MTVSLNTSVSLDTNVLLSLWNREPAAELVVEALEALKPGNRLPICGPVYAELCGRTPDLDGLLVAAGIEIESDLTLAGWRRAGQAHAAHAMRRKTSGGGTMRRTLTDFLIGAHASTAGYSLLTLNVTDFGDFPEVPLLTVTL